MIKNVGGVDRVIRIVGGGALLLYAVLGGSAWAYLGILPLLSGLTGFCPAYCPLNASTARGESCCSKKADL